MPESLRRFQRYTLAPDEFTQQRLKNRSFFASLMGWKECRVKDMSEAGALILTKHQLGLGDEVQLELSPRQGAKMVFEGEVVNLGIDHATKVNKIGIRLTGPRGGTTEANFLSNLEACFKPSL